VCCRGRGGRGKRPAEAQADTDPGSESVPEDEDTAEAEEPQSTEQQVLLCNLTARSTQALASFTIVLLHFTCLFVLPALYTSVLKGFGASLEALQLCS
jgi:hypothetical protein